MSGQDRRVARRAFTVRVDHAPGHREVFACDRYLVTYGDDGTASVAMHGTPESPGGPVTVMVQGTARAYVMNAAGVTCDVVRPRPGVRPAGEARP